MSPDHRPARAKSLLDQGNYPEAGALYHQLWDATADPRHASRYLYCLRKAGHPGAAVTVGRRAHEQHPQDAWVRRELVWALYEGRVKPLAKENDLEGLLCVAEEIRGLEPEPLPLRLVAAAVIKAAKSKGKWDLVCAWCDCLDPESLDDSPREIGGRPGKSEREAWYFSKIKALHELQRWQEGVEWARRASLRYPREINFRRWAALGMAGLGHVQQAINQLQEIVLKDRSEWYLLQDLCELHLRFGDQEAALRNACRAALDCPDDKVKVSLYHLLGKIGLGLSQYEFAFRHFALARAIRDQNGWKIPAELLSLDAEARRRFASEGTPMPEVPVAIREQSRACIPLWRAAAYVGLPRQSGVIDSPPEDRAFGWIRGQEGQRIFVHRDDLPPAARTRGEAVEFALEPSFDRKREQWTVRAVDVVHLPHEVSPGSQSPVSTKTT